MLQAPGLGYQQLAPWTQTSFGVNVSGFALNLSLNESDSFQNSIKIKDDKNRTANSGVTSSLLLSQLLQTTLTLSEEQSHPSNMPLNVKRERTSRNDSSVIIKISLLLVVTAFVLVASYKFVVHLFVGYSDRKDDPFSDSCSEDEDSTGMKKHHGPILDIG
ncbi:hypothetical protein ElyMa_002348200 [Elysia marginata]|uniref:Uncharacterized protein n=1 Tax=Elysia marginata TaxID=1093978 RepID=A0AAV4G9F5_9GAST|nr:hypothetical protein ElyMa_002348200 [Elysia marginata]